VETERRRPSDIHLCENERKQALSVSVAKRRAIVAIESKIGDVVAHLPHGPRKRLLVAISGGPDSTAVLLALYRIHAKSDLELAAAHLNHGIRGLESDRDEQFVRELCGSLDIQLVVERVRGLRRANLEERARQLRYEFLNRTADGLDAGFIVLGHHQDDQAETVLLRLMRGTGIAGLAAMAELGPGRLVRPLLSIGRSEILTYLSAIGANYVIDSSNLAEGALRNRVRRRLLPELAHDYSPRIARRLAELAAETRELNDFIQAEACRSLDRRLIPPVIGHSSSCRMDVRGFGSVSPALARAVIRELVRRCVGDLRRIGRAHIDAMWRLAISDKPSGVVVLPRRWRLRREYDSVICEGTTSRATHAATTLGDAELRLMPGSNPVSGSGITVAVREITMLDPSFPSAPWHPPGRFEAYFDADKSPELTVRNVRAGDRIRPLGLHGSRKVHDVFIDYKVRAKDRSSWPLVVFRDQVVWIPGLVRSGVALVTPASKRILHLRVDSLQDCLKV
jgi:tRNA(Ile)-lysidine synthase